MGFAPQAYNLEGDYNFYIYNRWGELIFQSTDLNTKWMEHIWVENVRLMYVWKVYYSVEHPDGNPRKEQKNRKGFVDKVTKVVNNIDKPCFNRTWLFYFQVNQSFFLPTEINVNTI